jgi:hypothetical protein
MAEKKTKGAQSPFDPTLDPPPEPAGPGPDELPIETWAERKGMLPMYHRTSMGNRLNPDYGKFFAAKVSRNWNDGQHVTEQAFDAAIASLDEHRFG